MARRDAGDGTVYWNKTHKYWEGQYVVGRDEAGKLTRRYCTDPNKAACKAKLKAIIDKVKADAAQRVRTPDTYTVKQCVQTWFDWATEEKIFGAHKLATYRGQAEHWIYPEHGDTPLKDFSAQVMQGLLKKAAPHLGAWSLRDLHGTMRRSITHAMITGPGGVPLIDHNDALLIQVPKAGQAPKDSSALAKAQVDALLKSGKGQTVRVVLGLGCLLGLRPKEIRTVQWDDIDFDAGVLYVVRWIKEGTQSRRGLQMPRLMVSILQVHKTLQDAERTAAGDAWVETGLVATMPNGAAYTTDGLYWRVKVAYRNAGLEFTDPYRMRHTFATRLDDADVPLKDISVAMGHATEDVTRKVYIHRFKPIVRGAASVMDDIFGDEDDAEDAATA